MTDLKTLETAEPTVTAPEATENTTAKDTNPGGKKKLLLMTPVGVTADALGAEAARRGRVLTENAAVERRQTIGSLIADLLLDSELAYHAIEELVRKKFPNAHTSRRSIASVASHLRKAGVEVASRRDKKAMIAGE